MQFCRALVAPANFNRLYFMRLISAIILDLVLQSFFGTFLARAQDNIPEIYRICSEDIDCIGVLASYPPMCRVFASNKKSKYEVLSYPPQKSIYRGGEAGERYNCYNHLCTIYNKCENNLCVTSHELQKYSEYFDPLTKNCSKEK